MATTIITKHGTGAPTSLAVGELAIDKSGPTLYTNTGGGVEAFSSGGGGGGVLNAPINYNAITLGGSLGSSMAVSPPSNVTALTSESDLLMKPTQNFSWTSGANLIIQAESGKGFSVLIDRTIGIATAFSAYSNSSSAPRNRGNLINVGGLGIDIPIAWDLSGQTASNIKSWDNSSVLHSGVEYVCEKIEIKGPIGSNQFASHNSFRLLRFRYVYL